MQKLIEKSLQKTQLPKSIKASWISDAGHGWLSVSNMDFALLGLDGISHFSYMNAARCYLEEDCDAGIFFKRLEELGLIVNVKPTQPKWVERSFVRSLAGFNQYWIDKPLARGSSVYVPSLKRSATVTELSKHRIKIQVAGQEYQITKSNPFKYIVPPQSSLAGDVK